MNMKKALMLLVVGLVSVSFASQQLAQQKGCMACHAMNAKKVGPAYADIAKRYAGRADAVDYSLTRSRTVALVYGVIYLCPVKM
jgi:cytochrome c